MDSRASGKANHGENQSLRSEIVADAASVHSGGPRAHSDRETRGAVENLDAALVEKEFGELVGQLLQERDEARELESRDVVGRRASPRSHAEDSRRRSGTFAAASFRGGSTRSRFGRHSIADTGAGVVGGGGMPRLGMFASMRGLGFGGGVGPIAEKKQHQHRTRRRSSAAVHQHHQRARAASIMSPAAMRALQAMSDEEDSYSVSTSEEEEEEEDETKDLEGEGDEIRSGARPRLPTATAVELATLGGGDVRGPAPRLEKKKKRWERALAECDLLSERAALYVRDALAERPLRIASSAPGAMRIYRLVFSGGYRRFMVCLLVLWLAIALLEPPRNKATYNVAGQQVSSAVWAPWVLLVETICVALVLLDLGLRAYSLGARRFSDWKWIFCPGPSDPRHPLYEAGEEVVDRLGEVILDAVDCAFPELVGEDETAKDPSVIGGHVAPARRAVASWGRASVDSGFHGMEDSERCAWCMGCLRRCADRCWCCAEMHDGLRRASVATGEIRGSMSSQVVHVNMHRLAPEQSRRRLVRGVRGTSMDERTRMASSSLNPLNLPAPITRGRVSSTIAPPVSASRGREVFSSFNPLSNTPVPSSTAKPQTYPEDERDAAILAAVDAATRNMGPSGAPYQPKRGRCNTHCCSAFLQRLRDRRISKREVSTGPAKRDRAVGNKSQDGSASSVTGSLMTRRTPGLRALAARGQLADLLSLILAVVCAFDVVVAIISFLAVGPTGSESWPRFSRPLRALFVVVYVESIRQWAYLLLRLLPKIVETLALMALVLAMFAVSAVLFFGGLDDEAPAACCDSFSTLGSALLSVTVLSTTENYPDVSVPAREHQPLSALWFVAFLTVSVFLLANLIAPILFRALRDFRRELAVSVYVQQRRALMAAFSCLSVGPDAKVHFPMFERMLLRLRPSLVKDPAAVRLMMRELQLLSNLPKSATPRILLSADGHVVDAPGSDTVPLLANLVPSGNAWRSRPALASTDTLRVVSDVHSLFDSLRAGDTRITATATTTPTALVSPTVSNQLTNSIPRTASTSPGGATQSSLRRMDSGVNNNNDTGGDRRRRMRELARLASEKKTHVRSGDQRQGIRASVFGAVARQKSESPSEPPKRRATETPTLSHAPLPRTADPVFSSHRSTKDILAHSEQASSKYDGAESLSILAFFRILNVVGHSYQKVRQQELTARHLYKSALISHPFTRLLLVIPPLVSLLAGASWIQHPAYALRMGTVLLFLGFAEKLGLFLVLGPRLLLRRRAERLDIFLLSFTLLFWILMASSGLDMFPESDKEAVLNANSPTVSQALPILFFLGLSGRALRIFNLILPFRRNMVTLLSIQRFLGVAFVLLLLLTYFFASIGTDTFGDRIPQTIEQWNRGCVIECSDPSSVLAHSCEAHIIDSGSLSSTPTTPIPVSAIFNFQSSNETIVTISSSTTTPLSSHIASGAVLSLSNCQTHIHTKCPSGPSPTDFRPSTKSTISLSSASILIDTLPTSTSAIGSTTAIEPLPRPSTLPSSIPPFCQGSRVQYDLPSFVTDAGNMGSFPEAMLAMFQILTTSNWHEILYTYLFASHNPTGTVIFFVSFFILSVLFTLNLVVAIFIDAFESVQDSDDVAPNLGRFLVDRIEPLHPKAAQHFGAQEFVYKIKGPDHVPSLAAFLQRGDPDNKIADALQRAKQI